MVGRFGLRVVVVYVRKLIPQRVEYFANAAVVVLPCEIRLEIFCEHISDSAARQRALKPHALHAPIIVVTDGQEQQNAVIFAA